MGLVTLHFLKLATFHTAKDFMRTPGALFRATGTQGWVSALRRRIDRNRSHIFIGLVFIFYATATVVALSLAAGGSRDAIGYLASLFVLGSFGSHAMLPLRVLALLSNVAFIAYAARNQLGPVLALHALLLPINALRLRQLLAATRPPASGPHSNSAASPERKRPTRRGRMMARLATLSVVLLMLLVRPAHDQELLGDPELRPALVTPTPPRAAVDMMEGSRLWRETTAQQILLREMMQWVSSNLDLPMVRDLPRTAHAGPATIATLRYRILLAAQQPAASSAVQYVSQQTVAIYLDDERTIYLPLDFTGQTAEDLSVLVHELVHHIQNVASLRHECPQAREKDAYLAQERWLAQFDKSLDSVFGVDPFTVLVNGLCGY